MMRIKFRQAKCDDLEEMQELFVGTVKNTCRNDYNENQINAWITSVKNKEKWQSILANQHVLIAEIDEKIIGFGSLKNGNYIDVLYIHKNFIRKGIATLIFKKLKEKSLKFGFDRLTADVSKTARPFFENKGFQVIRENKNKINGVNIINYHMRQ